MDNWKRSLTGSGQNCQTETGKWFRREPDLENLAGKQEPAGFGTAAPNRRTGPGWR